MTKAKLLFSTLFGPRGAGGHRNGECEASKNARCREEENEPIGETIGAEMTKRMRDKQTNKQTLRAFVNRCGNQVTTVMPQLYNFKTYKIKTPNFGDFFCE